LAGLRNFGATQAELAVAGTGMFNVFKAWSAGLGSATAFGALKLLGYSANAPAARFERVAEILYPLNHMRSIGGRSFPLPS